jgi:tetratricopeptide (TPR) repeat protein
MRDSPAVSGGDALSVPSPAEVEHADWPVLKQMCESLGLNPKGRSAVVRMRVLDHVRRHGRPEPWRAGREHLAPLLTRLGFAELSEDVWESTIQLDAPAPWLGLGQAQLAGGVLTEAAKSFDRAIRMGDEVGLLHQAEVSAAGGDYDRAVRACALYRAKHPEDLRALAMQSDFLARAGFADEAARAFVSAAESRREIPGLLRAGGTDLLKAGRADASIDVLTEAIRSDPADLESRINRGTAFLLAGRTQEAITSFHEVLEIDPNRAEALNNLGVAHLQLGQSKSAVKYIGRAAKLTDSPRILLNLEKLRGSELARRRSRRASQAKPDAPPEESDRATPSIRNPRPRKGRKR